MKRKFYIFMAIISGLVFGGSLYYYLQNMEQPTEIKTKTIVTAAADIPARSIIQTNQLEIKEIPEESFPQGGSANIEAVAGNVSLVNLKKGDWVLNPMVYTSDRVTEQLSNSPQESISLTVPEGKRAVAVPVGLIGSVGHKLRPGDRVDVLVTIDIRDESGTKTITSLAAQDVLVLNTGFNSQAESKSRTDSCILALTVPQAMAVTLGSERGSIRLLLRNPVNKEMYEEWPIDPSIYFSPDYFSHFKEGVK